VPFFHDFCKLLWDAGRTTVEEMAILRTRLTAERFHQFWAVNSSFDLKPILSPQPNKRHSIWYNQIRFVQDVPEPRIMYGFRDAVHAGGRKKSSNGAGHNSLHPSDDFWNLNGMDTDAENIKPRQPLVFGALFHAGIAN
jgi:hypothetical protein